MMREMGGPMSRARRLGRRERKQQGGPNGVALRGVLGGNQCRASLLHEQHKQVELHPFRGGPRDR